MSIEVPESNPATKPGFVDQAVVDQPSVTPEPSGAPIRATLDVSHVVRPTPRLSSKSPFYEAANSGRYHRQDLIREINRSNERHLLCYVGGPQSTLERADVLGFADLLHHVPDGADIDLMLHTLGGDPYATEKIVSMFWSRIGKGGTFRVIVPDLAKSAGTLLALGADQIIMSETSELGPIDPQIVRRTSAGVSTVAVQHHLDAYKNACKGFRDKPDDPVTRVHFERFEAPTIAAYEAVVKKARKVSDKHLAEGMFRRAQKGNYTKITSELLDTDKWVTHQASSEQARPVSSASLSVCWPTMTPSGNFGGACTVCTVWRSEGSPNGSSNRTRSPTILGHYGRRGFPSPSGPYRESWSVARAR
jgi:hypothetical protein